MTDEELRAIEIEENTVRVDLSFGELPRQRAAKMKQKEAFARAKAEKEPAEQAEKERVSGERARSLSRQGLGVR